MVIFHSYVSLPEGKLKVEKSLVGGYPTPIERLIKIKIIIPFLYGKSYQDLKPPTSLLVVKHGTLW